MIAETAKAIGSSQSLGQGLLPPEMKPWGFTPASAPGVGINISARGRLVVSVWRPHPSIYGWTGGSPFSLGAVGRGEIRFLTPNLG